MNEDEAWTLIEEAERQTLAGLFAAQPERLSSLTIRLPRLYFDFSKTHPTPSPPAGLEPSAVARASDAPPAPAARPPPPAPPPSAGGLANPTEGRSAEHSAERGQGAPESVAR